MLLIVSEPPHGLVLEPMIMLTPKLLVPAVAGSTGFAVVSHPPCTRRSPPLILLKLYALKSMTDSPPPYVPCSTKIVPAPRKVVAFAARKVNKSVKLVKEGVQPLAPGTGGCACGHQIGSVVVAMAYAAS